MTSSFVIPVPTRIGDHLERHVDDRPDQPFLVQGERQLTYAATKALVDRHSAALLASGVERGDRVAMLGNPSIEFWITFLATTGIGAIWLGLNPKYTDGELDHVVNDADPKLVFVPAEIDGDDGVEVAAALLGRHHDIERSVVLGSESHEDWLATADSLGPAQLEAAVVSVDTMDPAFLVYTSGSTGRPKGALITHRGSNVCNSIAVERKHLRDRRMICNLPINHVGAIGDIAGRVMTGGGTLHFQERFSPADMLATIEAERLNTIAGVPTMLQMCVEHEDFATRDLSSVDLVAWGGAAMPAELLRRLLDATGAPYATMGYGMTELTGGVTYSGLTDPVDVLATTIGTADPRQDMRIMHPDGHVCAPGDPGEIQARGDWLMAGYWRNPEATAAAFTDDGWFHTGDLAVELEDGNHRIVGRMSEMFKSGGYNVYPREVELALEEHPAIAMAAVVSIPDAKFQEVGVAFLMASNAVSPADATAFAAERLANYKVPKRIEILDELPMLPIGKVDKAALRARALG